MLVHDIAPLHEAELSRALEREIVQRTWGRIHRLRVERVNERWIVQGWTSSYYVKQLAWLAVHDVLEATGLSFNCEVDIEVGSGDPAPPGLHPRNSGAAEEAGL